MPVKLGEEGTLGCTGDKPWPLVNVNTGKKEACAGPDRATAIRAVQARNMAHAGLLKRTWQRVYRAVVGEASSAGKSDTGTAASVTAGAIDAYGLQASLARRISDMRSQKVDRGVLTLDLPWVRLHGARIWTEPQEPPWVELSRSVRIVKQDEEKHVALSVTMEPADPAEIANWVRDGKKDPAPRGVDSQGDWTFAEDIERAAYGFMGRYRQGTGIKLGHEGDFIPAEIVESYLAPVDFDLENQRVVKGSWLQALRFPDRDLWELVKQNMGGWSIGGRAERSEE